MCSWYDWTARLLQGTHGSRMQQLRGDVELPWPRDVGCTHRTRWLDEQEMPTPLCEVGLAPQQDA